MYSERFDLRLGDFKQQASFFYDNGYVILDNALSDEQVKQLRLELNNVNTEFMNNQKQSKKNKLAKGGGHIVYKCFFENSPTTVSLIEESLITDFAQYVISDVPGNRKESNSLTAHVIHNNAFIVPPNGRGQAAKWHVDDPLQQIIIPNNYSLPSNIRLPVLVCTYMIWLSDCETPENGPTYVVPGSHRFGKELDEEEANIKGIPMCGKAGTAILINSNLWHRGCQNTSETPRETLQITFGRRIIGHKHGTIMNYQMPEHVYIGKSDKLKERMGFLQGGAYS